MRHVKTWLPAVSVFSLAFIVRIIYNMTVAHGYVPNFDAAIYEQLAQRLLSDHCYCWTTQHATTFRPPLWPFIIAGIYAIAGPHNTYVRLLCCFLGAGTSVFVYFFARDLFGKRIALVTGVIAAVYTGLFIWDGWLYTESLYTFCLVVFLYSLYRLQGKVHVRTWVIVAGVLLGLAMLTRPNGTILLGLLGLWALALVFFKYLSWQAVVKRSLLIVLIAVAVITPWSIRNYPHTHSLLPVSTLGNTLRGAYNDVTLHDPGLRGIWWLSPAYNADIHDYTLADENRDMQAALDWLHSHVSDIPYMFGVHLVNMWTPYMYSYDLPFEEFPTRQSSKLVMDLIPLESIIVFIFAAFGLVLSWKKRKELLLVYLIIAFTIAQNVVFYGSNRFRAPIEPFLVLLVGGVLWWMTNYWKTRTQLAEVKDAQEQPALVTAV
ncbi:MAG TPA: glycosyltransferase family 39 protein [Ktedonobacteraceae bacterium]|nr:glycosyltransferase family 39 protein [Ktedonobacteraceae bacterium]